MAHSKWCGKDCSICIEYCGLDESMPCSPGCNGLNPVTDEPNGEQCKGCDAILTENDFDSKTQIAIIWSIEDVKGQRDDLDHNQCMEVLLALKRNHDANCGICWDSIDSQAEILYPIK